MEGRSNLRAVLNTAGGLRYHLRGARSASRSWAPFRQSLGIWLEEWLPEGDRLVLVGPSAGYCLRPEWLARFGEIVCLDPDPVARILFTRRVREASRVHWHHDDFLRERDPLAQQEVFARFLDRYPGAPVLFSNFLGQLPLLLGDRGAATLVSWKSRLVPELLLGHAWASFHDRVSGPLAPREFVQPLKSPRRLTDAEVIEQLYPSNVPSCTGGDPAELSDHETAGFFPPNQPHVYFRWPLTSGWIHTIEATHSVRSASTT